MPSDPLALRALLDALDEPAMIVNGLNIRVANAAAKALLGSRIEGRDVRFAIRQPHALESILAGRAAEVEATGIGELGRSWRLLVRELGGGNVLVRMIDRSAAVAAEKMRVDFVANASHELRTPLSAILGYGETLADEPDLPPELRRTFGATIRDEARRMMRIIEDLMSLSRIEADRFVAPGERVTLERIVKASLVNARNVPGSAACGLDVSLAPDLPEVRGDFAQLTQVLDNLLSNAIRYGCAASVCRVSIAAEREDRWVRLTVADNGPGIAREHLPRVTERFYRVDPARSRDTGGTGLGLAIVKHVVERHRGTLEIRSTPGQGTSVTVRLPVA